MFTPSPWARAFINSVEKAGGKAEDGIDMLKALASWTASLPGIVIGITAAEKIEKLIRESITQISLPGERKKTPPALETAIRFLIMLLRKNMFRHVDQVVNEAKRILDKKNGVITACLEYVFPPANESRIKESIKKQTRAARVNLTGQINKDLIGGYKLRIGDEIIDASVRSQLRRLEICLNGNGGD